MGRWIALVVVLGIAAVVLYASTYTLDETEQAVIIQFGAPVGEPVTEPGLHFKKPFIQEVRRFDRRLIAWDGDPNQIPTRGREFISVDTTARWRIVDPLLFLKSVRDEAGAQSRMNDIVDSVVRDKVSSTELVEIVRSKDWDVDPRELDRALQTDSKQKEVLQQQVRIGRQELIQSIVEEARKLMPRYGIELADVRIKRLNYIPSVQQQVFGRMTSERQRVAEQFRAEGEGQSSRFSARPSGRWRRSCRTPSARPRSSGARRRRKRRASITPPTAPTLSSMRFTGRWRAMKRAWVVTLR